MQKRGQAATELMMTYSWTFIVIVVCIGAFAYANHLDGKSVTAEQCYLQQPLVCSDASADKQRISFHVTNLGLEDIQGVTVEFENLDQDITCTPVAILSQLGETITCFSSEELPAGIQTDLRVNYTKTMSNLYHSSDGRIVLSTE